MVYDRGGKRSSETCIIRNYMKKGIDKKKEQNIKQIHVGMALIKSHGLFGRLEDANVSLSDRGELGRYKAAKVSYGHIHLNADVNKTPGEWAYIIIHCRLHMAFGHFDAEKMPGYDPNTKTVRGLNPALWNIACDIYISKYMRAVGFGKPVGENPADYFDRVPDDEQQIYKYLLENEWPDNSQLFGVSCDNTRDMDGLGKPIVYGVTKIGWWVPKKNGFASEFAKALAWSITNAVSEAGGHGSYNDSKDTAANNAASWFLGHYPLLGSLASSFTIEQNPEVCRKHDVYIAAIDVDEAIIYVNMSRNLSEKEWRFVLAHEYLHAGLQHASRCAGRDPYIWNVACDYVINEWLIEMGVGTMPEGLLLDPALKGLSAEEIYDEIIKNIKQYAKFLTMGGYGKGDIFGKGTARLGDGVRLDDFCRDALLQGLEYQLSSGRGTIPAGLIQEIRALAMPPIRWDVKLADWFDENIIPVEKHRSYAYPSRRQSSTPDIPRPRYVRTETEKMAATFGVVIDTSGSMSTQDIGKALGSVASYAASKDVPAVRVVFCDADAYDAGYLETDAIAGRVEIKGRGGTRLQPAVDLLQNAKDFPKNGPILLITDGWIEKKMDIKRKHAFLIPQGRRLPFKAKGEVFYFE